MTTPQLKQNSQNDPFKNALREWLAGETTGHLGMYMYTDDQNDQRWKKGHSSSNYYVGHDDEDTFKLAVSDLDFDIESFLDLGPGGEASLQTKSLPIMQAMHAKNYYPVELSPTLANDALAFMQNRLGVGGETIITDFFDQIPGKKDNAFIAIMGGTIGNFETHTDTTKLKNRLAQIFSIYHRAVGQKSYLLVSFDANNNAKELIDCYDNPEFDVLIRGRLESTIDMDGFDYHVRWTPENYQLALGVKSNRDQIITLDGEDFAIENGEYLPVLNSYRFPVSFTVDAAARAGWTPLKTWSKTGRIHYLLFEQSA